MTKAATILRREVERQGAVSFARFMELALYCPDCGYYEQEENRIGRGGDFFTSVSTGSLYGELLATRFALWSANFGNNRIQIVEAGAHDGRLALDVLKTLQSKFPATFEELEYWLVEPSRRRKEWQQENLDDFRERVFWVDEIDDLSFPGVSGVIFSNEFIDALPIHRLEWDVKSGSWHELGVRWSDDQFVWTRLKSGSDWKQELQEAGFLLPPELEAVLPNGFVLELCPSAVRWWSSAAKVLKRGYLMTADYGMSADDFLRPERASGTLRAYSFHRSDSDILSRPGEQDLTAHVNFTALMNAGERMGLRTDSYGFQSQFLTEIIEVEWKENARLAYPQREHLGQLRTLTHPEHLGRFRVLVQSRLP